MAADALGVPAADDSENLSTRVAASISQWQAELLDLSKANRLLFFKPGSGSLRLLQPAAESLFDALANRNRGLTFYRPDAREDAEEQLELVLDGEDDDGGHFLAAAAASH